MKKIVNRHIHSGSAHKLCVWTKRGWHGRVLFCFPTRSSTETKLLFASGWSFFFHPLYSIFLLHSTVDCQFLNRVVYVFEASAKLIQSRVGALWLRLSPPDGPLPARRGSAQSRQISLSALESLHRSENTLPSAHRHQISHKNWTRDNMIKC